MTACVARLRKKGAGGFFTVGVRLFRVSPGRSRVRSIVEIVIKISVAYHYHVDLRFTAATAVCRKQSE